ncbi:SMC-Scp complex subunit ScpB [Clostridiisalibacter paucivorans]|uniref:SMC-Scp complex subunit ScpB n=1 Tax=Clostridiisalibacter paucivorans TaxID=408753 RepID=UPI00047CF30D|nr:SMC-Scp complex subunit ScpB [Clostridiisalibacter paucivorans]
MDNREIKSIIESLLFIWGEPLDINDIKEILKLQKRDIKKLIDEMIDEFNYNRRGVQIIQIEDKYQLATRSEHYEFIKKLCAPKSNKNLSNAALETLAIIAYKQPITRVDIEGIRGVKCDKSINTLMEKELVKEVGRLEKTGKPILYGTTDFFIKYFGLKSLDELPSIEKFIEDNFNTKE